MRAPQLGAKRKYEDDKAATEKLRAELAALPAKKSKPVAVVVPDPLPETEKPSSPRQYAKEREINALVTHNGINRLSDLVRTQIKELSHGNQLFFTANDVAYKLIEMYLKSHSDLITDPLPFFKFAKTVGHSLNGMTKSYGAEKIVRTQSRMNATFGETPFIRPAYGYRWGVVVAQDHPTNVSAASIAPAALVEAPQPSQGILRTAKIDYRIPHPDTEQTPESSENADKLQELITTLNYQQCENCLQLLVSRFSELHGTLLKRYVMLLENDLAMVRGFS